MMKNGWKMKDIDEMDFIGFLKVRAWQLNWDRRSKKTTIDKAWPGLRPQ